MAKLVKYSLISFIAISCADDNFERIVPQGFDFWKFNHFSALSLCPFASICSIKLRFIFIQSKYPYLVKTSSLYPNPLENSLHVKQSTLSFDIPYSKNENTWNHFLLNFRWCTPMRILGYDSKIGCFGPELNFQYTTCFVYLVSCFVYFDTRKYIHDKLI